VIPAIRLLLSPEIFPFTHISLIPTFSRWEKGPITSALPLAALGPHDDLKPEDG
jgi:hypothetical protein